ncbi:MAG: dockerin type I domain-containing protein, partial [Planctomycetes bacterium]|nr:dockerin type I domain-containing protein [Planctomycetota bacterium]
MNITSVASARQFPLRRRRMARRCRHRRLLLFERLENRVVLASDWHNSFLASDVNDDGLVTPLDCLIVLEKCNRDGPGPLSSLGEGEPEAFFDTSDDGLLTARDVLLVVNDLNLASSQDGADTGDADPVDIYVIADDLGAADSFESGDF